MPYKSPEEQREFQRKWVQKRRKKHMDGKKCAMCGKPVSAKTSDLDHKTPHQNTEKIDHRLWSLKDSKRKKKLKGMQILCKSCHKKKTAKDIKKMHEDIVIMATEPLQDLSQVSYMSEGLERIDKLIRTILNK